MPPAVSYSALLSEALSAWSYSPATVAERAGLDLDAVQSVLDGDGDVSDTDAVARALGGTIDDLLAGHRFWEAPAAAFKSAPSTVEPLLVRAALLRLAGAARDRAALVALLNIDDPPTGVGVFSTQPLDADVPTQAEELAKAVRSHFGNPTGALLSVRELMHSLGVATFLTDVGAETIDGVMWRGVDGHACAAVNVRARGAKLTAIRMTFAHELCHALFDGKKDTAFGIVETPSDRSVDLERRASAFAAHLLAPRDAVGAVLRKHGLRDGEKPGVRHLLALSRHFVVGVEAMASHLVSCGFWRHADMRTHRIHTPWFTGGDDRERTATDAESIVAIERRGDVLNFATLALERAEITAGRWRELLGLRLTDGWRELLAEQQVELDAEHRSDA